MKIYPFMRYKYWLIGLLGAVTAFALIAIFVVGLHLGIEFKGGVKAEVRLTEASTSLEVREAFAAALREIASRGPIAWEYDVLVCAGSFNA